MRDLEPLTDEQVDRWRRVLRRRVARSTIEKLRAEIQAELDDFVKWGV